MYFEHIGCNCRLDFRSRWVSLTGGHFICLASAQNGVSNVS